MDILRLRVFFASAVVISSILPVIATADVLPYGPICQQGEVNRFKDNPPPSALTSLFEEYRHAAFAAKTTKESRDRAQQEMLTYGQTNSGDRDGNHRRGADFASKDEAYDGCVKECIAAGQNYAAAYRGNSVVSYPRTCKNP